MWRSLSSGSSSAARDHRQPDHRRLLAADPREEPQNVRFPDPGFTVYGSARARFLWPKDGMTISLAEAVRLRFRLWVSYRNHLAFYLPGEAETPQ